MKRIIVLMLACLMLLSCLPFAAFAAEEAHEAELAECPGKGKAHGDEHIHLAEVITKVDPQCGERGYTLYQCGECEGMFLGSYVEADPTATHTWTTVTAAVAATCTKAGKTAVVKCTVCGTQEGGKATEKAPHNFVLSATTGEVMCENCGEIQPESDCTFAVDKKHNWDYTKPVATVDPTCSVAGSATFACSNKGCKETKTIVIEATGKHEFGKLVELKTATCTESGVSRVHYTCETCDKVFAEDKTTELKAKDYFVAAKGHAYKCTTTATKVACENGCGELITVADAKPIHNTTGNTKYLAATCTTYGYDIATCIDCGQQVKNKVLDPLGHKIDSTKAPALDTDKEINKPGEEGKACAPLYNRYYCTRATGENTVCDEPVYVKVKDAQPHSYVEDVVIQEATCTLKKKTASVCSVCGNIDDATIVEHEINADNHVSVSVVRRIADCTAGGTAIVSCNNCTYVSNVTVAKNTAHKLVYTAVAEGDVTNEPTCTEEGKGNVRCEYCEAADKTDGKQPIPALGHNNGEVVETIPATCLNGVIEKYEGDCERCHIKTWTVEVGKPSTALTFNSKAEANVVHKNLVAAADNNCENGYEYYTCSDCAGTKTNNVFVYSESTNHTFENYICVGTKDDSDNKYYNICVACGFKKEATANAHSMKFVSAVKPSCTTTGSIKFACKNASCTYAIEFNATTTNPTFVEEWAELLIAYFGEDFTKAVKEYTDLHYADAKAEAEEAAGEDFNAVEFEKEFELAATEYALEKLMTAAIAATGHKPNTPKETQATCLTDGYKAETKCTVCGTITASAVVTKATNHNFDFDNAEAIASTTLACLQAEYNVYKCINDNCNAEIVVDYIPARNHENKAGDVITPSCTDTVADRKCVHCAVTVPTHNAIVDDTHKVSDCTTQGYTITYCDVCNEILKTVLTPGFGEHNYVDVEDWATEKEFIADVKAGNVDNVIYTPALYKDGKIEFVCSGCDLINEELTITLKAEDEIGKDYNKYIGLTLAVDNANKAGAAISDSSVVAITVNLNSAAEIGVWGVNFKFAYNFTKLTYIGYEFAEGSAFDGYTNAVQKFTYAPAVRYSSLVDVEIGANDKVTYIETEVDAYYEVERAIGAYITIGANTANDVNGNTVDATINGENNALVTLYFEVDNEIVDNGVTVEDKVGFGITDVTILNKKGDDVKHNEEIKTLTVEKFLDFNKDGVVNFADVLCVWKMISGETEADYNAVVDVDKNGIVEAKDFMDLYSFVLGELDYEDMVAIVAEEEVAA